MGPFYKNCLKNLGLVSWRDLLFHKPTRFECFSLLETTSLTDRGLVQFALSKMTLQRQTCCFKGICNATNQNVKLFFQKKQSAWLQDKLSSAPLFLVWGTFKKDDAGTLVFFHPHIRPFNPSITYIQQAIYPETKGLKSAFIAKLAQNALERMPLMPVPFGNDVLDLKRLFQDIHRDPDAADDALKKLAILENSTQTLFWSQKRCENQKLSAFSFSKDTSIALDHLKMQGFTLSPSQDQALEKITGDMTRCFPMRRLLQGDVGSGKTLVALAAIRNMLGEPKNDPKRPKAVFLAPTLLLATQVHGVWESLFPDIPALLLTRQTPAKKKALGNLSKGEYQFIVGTHALLGEAVTIPNLGFLVIDEQQRFGVLQRLRLTHPKTNTPESAQHYPHVLLMTATPIPRTQRLSVTEDLDTSYLALRKPNQKSTYVTNNGSIDAIVQKLKIALQSGQKGFWVCPAIDAEGTKATVQKRFEFLQPIFKDALGLLHGAMKADQQKETLDAFKDGQKQLLVCTTVIETGIDVPDASWMVIEDAPFFGLSSLHQLRGRVGRAGQKATIIALYKTPLSLSGRKRLATFRQFDDGFDIAQKDLSLRGHGTLLGFSQSGFADALPPLNTHELQISKTAADNWQKDPESTPYHALLYSVFLGLTEEQNTLRAG